MVVPVGAGEGGEEIRIKKEEFQDLQTELCAIRSLLGEAISRVRKLEEKVDSALKGYEHKSLFNERG